MTVPEIFDVVVAVYDSTLQSIESAIGHFSITLRVFNADYDISSEKTTSSGLATFASLAYPRSNFSIEASCASMVSISEQIQVIDDSVLNLEVNGPNETLYTKKVYDYDILLYRSGLGVIQVIPNGLVEVLLDSSKYSETTTDLEGKSKFSISLNSSGNFTLDFAYNTTQQTLIAPVQSSEPRPPLLRLSVTDHLQTMCQQRLLGCRQLQMLRKKLLQLNLSRMRVQSRPGPVQ